LPWSRIALVAVPLALVLIAILPVLVNSGLEGGWRQNSDLSVYSAVAVAFKNGHGILLPNGEPFPGHGPVLPGIMGTVWAVTGVEYLPIVWISRLLGLAGIVAGFFFARKLAGNFAGLIMGLLLATSPVATQLAFASIGVDAFALSFALMAMLAAVYAYDRDRLDLGLASGLLFALALLTKETLVLLMLLPLVLGTTRRLWADDQAAAEERGLPASYWRISAALALPSVLLGGAWVVWLRADLDVQFAGPTLPLSVNVVAVGAAVALLTWLMLRPPPLLQRVPATAVRIAGIGLFFLLAVLGLRSATAGLEIPTFNELRDYVSSALSERVWWLVMASALVLVCDGIIRRRVASLLLLSVFIAVLPLIAYAAWLDLSVRQILGPMVVAYLCVAVAAVVVVDYVSQAPVWSTDKAAVAAPTMALLIANFALILIPLAEDNATGYDETVGNNPFLTEDIPAVAAWIEANIEPGADIVVPDRYAYVLYVATDGKYRFWDVPLAKLRYDDDSPRLLRVLDERYPPVYRDIIEAMGEEPWIYLRAKPQTQLYKGFTEEALAGVINASGAGVAILMDDEFELMFLGHPNVHGVQTVGNARIFQFPPGAVELAPSQPLFTSEGTLRKLAGDAGIENHDDFKRNGVLTDNAVLTEAFGGFGR
jgi:hypothetical protein